MTISDILSAADGAFPDSRSMTPEESAVVYALIRSKFRPVLDALPNDPAADDEVNRIMAPIRNAGPKRKLLRKP